MVDLLCLDSMQWGHHCHLGVLFARYFHKMSSETNQKRKILMGGSFVTTLARNLGILEPENRWTRCYEMEPLGVFTLKQLDIVEEINGQLWLKGQVPAEERAAAQPATQEVPQQEEGRPSGTAHEQFATASQPSLAQVMAVLTRLDERMAHIEDSMTRVNQDLKRLFDKDDYAAGRVGPRAAARAAARRAAATPSTSAQPDRERPQGNTVRLPVLTSTSSQSAGEGQKSGTETSSASDSDGASSPPLVSLSSN